MSVVRYDTDGLLVIAGGYKARPGNVVGYSHAYRMDDGGLQIGDKVKAYHMSGTQLTRLILPSGQRLYWHHDPLPKEGYNRRTFDYEPDRYDIRGLRVYDQLPRR